MMTLRQNVCLLLFAVAISISSIKAQEIMRPVPDIDIGTPPKRKQCQSNNDPHMISFSGLQFEFHKIGKFCLARGKHFEVEAQYKPCLASSAVTCNCAVRINLLDSNNFAEINYCGANSWPPQILGGTVTFLNNQIACANVGPAFDPLNEIDWTSVTTGGPGFKCIYNGQTWIKSELSNPNDNVFVTITAPPGPKYPGIIGLLQVYVPEDMKSSGCKCLCDAVKEGPLNTDGDEGNEITILTDEQELQVNEIKPRCREALLGNTIARLNKAGLLTDEFKQKLEIFARNCAIDILMIKDQVKEFTPGLFQLDAIRTEICLLALKSPDGTWILELTLKRLTTDDCVKQLSSDTAKYN